MKNSIAYYLEETAKRFPDKIAYKDKEEEISFLQLFQSCKRIGSAISRYVYMRKPVIIYMKKNIRNIQCFFGAAFAGCFYIPLDEAMPIKRARLILDVVKPEMLIYDNHTSENLLQLGDIKHTFAYEDLLREQVNEDEIKCRVNNIRTTDLLYVLFTSGSTGVPKGVTISHGSVMDFMEWICETYEMDERTSLCNQAPFYFDASVPDLYIPLACGATTYVPPKSYYTFPQKVIQYVIDNNINTLIWVPSALCNVVDAKVFDAYIPDCVKLVIFCGEVMPCSYLNRWKKVLPDICYVNMYGPTEATYACTYYNIEKEFSDEDVLPIGKACGNAGILLITDNRQADIGEIGEICILGQCLSNGYYNDKNKTNAVFKQNPVNTKWNEMMYCTGDLGVMDTECEIKFIGRKDFQIKKNGFRIELGEIENAIRSIIEVENACCLFHKESNKVIAVYSGSINEEDVEKRIEEKLQRYMVPDKYIKLDKFPFNLNGKVDRESLKSMIMQREM